MPQNTPSWQEKVSLKVSLARIVPIFVRGPFPTPAVMRDIVKSTLIKGIGQLRTLGSSRTNRYDVHRGWQRRQTGLRTWIIRISLDTAFHKRLTAQVAGS